MRLFFLAATALCWLNAALVLWDMQRSPTPIYVVSVTLICVFLGVGWIVYRIQHHLFRSFDALAVIDGREAATIRTNLARMRVWLIILALVVAIAMLLCLTAILSRFQEGYPLFG